jgi:hypothetical protein
VQLQVGWLELARTIYIRCIYGIFVRDITKDVGHIRCICTVLANPKYTIMFGVYIRFWPTLNIRSYTVMYGVYVRFWPTLRVPQAPNAYYLNSSQVECLRNPLKQNSDHLYQGRSIFGFLPCFPPLVLRLRGLVYIGIVTTLL